MGASSVNPPGRSDADRTVSLTGRVSGTPQETPRGLRTAILARTRFARVWEPAPRRTRPGRAQRHPPGGRHRPSQCRSPSGEPRCAVCAYGFSCSRRKRGDGGRPAGRRRPGRQRERGGRVGVVRGRGGPRLGSLGRRAARQTKDGSWERKARPSTARRPSPGPHTRPCRSTTTSGTGRVAPTRCDASRSDGHTTPRTAHSPRPAHSNGGRAEWAPGLTGLGRGRRAMPASTSTTERHDQPARLHPCAGPGRPPATIARPAATRQRSPRPSRPGVQRGGFLAVATIRARGDLHKISAGERLETVTVHLCILRNAACHHCAGASQ